MGLGDRRQTVRDGVRTRYSSRLGPSVLSTVRNCEKRCIGELVSVGIDETCDASLDPLAGHVPSAKNLRPDVRPGTQQEPNCFASPTPTR